jgi:putative sigma-54 modulation protein
MHVTVTFRHMDSSDALRKYAEEKSTRIARFLAEPVEIHWVLSVERIRHIADATVSANGVLIKAQEATQDMYSAIDEVIDKLYIQVKKHKDRVKGHKNGETVSAVAYEGAAAPAVEAEVGAEPETTAARIIKRENRFIKPMSVEEAVMQLEEIDGDFLIFTDCETNNVSVIYKKNGGDYGLIETRTR